MKLKHLISIFVLLLLGACSDNKELTKDVELQMRIMSNTPIDNFSLTSEEFLQLLNNQGENYSSIDFSTLEITADVEGSAKIDDNNTTNFTFKGSMLSSSKLEDPNFPTYDSNFTTYEYPIKITFEAEPSKENPQTEYKFTNIALVDYYNGSFIQDSYIGDARNISFPIAALFEAKQTALDKDKVVEEILKIKTSGKEPEEIARSGFAYINTTFEYDKEKAELVRNSPYDLSVVQGLEKFAQSKMGVCYDFAYFYKMFLDTHGIENRLAFGNFEGDPSKINHVWNEIKINDKWIPIDTTGNGFGEEGKYENYVSIYTTNL